MKELTLNTNEVQDLPVLRGRNSPEYLLGDDVMERVGKLLAGTRRNDVEVAGFAA